MNKKTIITDFFGVVIDPNADTFFKKYCRDRKASELTHYYCHPGDLGLTTFDKMITDIARDWHFDREFVSHELHYGPKLHEKYVETLRELKKEGHKVILLSNAPDSVVEWFIELYHLEDLFDKTYISYKSKLVKPYTSAFFAVLNENHIKPREAIFIDDNNYNIISAEVCGIAPVHYVEEEQAVASLKELTK